MCSISILLLIIRITYPAFIVPEKIEFENLEMVEAELDSTSGYSANYKNYDERSTKLFAFDPNTATESDLISLGLRQKTAQTLIKFRSKGFSFKTKEDLKKIYGLSPKLYDKLEPYIVIANNGKGTSSENKISNSNTKVATKKLELNQADSLSLIELKGVGPGYAKRILKYRSLLGGFTNMEQVKEIYGMTDELYNLIAEQCVVDPKLITKININTVEFKVLNKHPYIDYELTKHIFNFRKSTKLTAANFEEVIQDETLIKKLQPYINFD